MVAEILEKIVRPLSWVDYLVLSIMLLISALIGLYFAWQDRKKKNLNTEDYLLGGREMEAWPVSLSLTASFMSSITVLGTPVEFYMNGSMFIWCALAYCLVPIVTAVFFIPVFYPLKISTSYQYFRLRYGSKALELASSTVYTIQTMLYMGIVLYAPSLALNQVTGINLWAAAAINTVICTVYTVLGGLKAVIWTDAFQAMTIIVGFISVIAVGSKDFGGMGNISAIYESAGRYFFTDFRIDPRIRHTFWTIQFGSVLGIWGGVFGINQSMVQRYFSCKSMKTAQRSVLYSAFGLVIILVLCIRIFLEI